MKQSQMHITENSRIARDVYRMRLAGSTPGLASFAFARRYLRNLG